MAMRVFCKMDWLVGRNLTLPLRKLYGDEKGMDFSGNTPFVPY